MLMKQKKAGTQLSNIKYVFQNSMNFSESTNIFFNLVLHKQSLT